MMSPHVAHRMWEALVKVGTTIAYEQVAIEITAAVAQREPDDYLAQTYRFGLPEDFDHLYRYTAMMDRLEGQDADNILRNYTDILPGRRTMEHHRAPQDDLRNPYDKRAAHPLSKMHALTILSSEQQTHNYFQLVCEAIEQLGGDPTAMTPCADLVGVQSMGLWQSVSDPRTTLAQCLNTMLVAELADHAG